jgi:hypothetical protein
MLKLRNQR